MTRAVSISKALRQVHRAPKSKVPEISTRHRLKKIRDVWDDFQASRTRDAVYGYLEAVFAIVIITKCGERPRSFCGTRSDLLICRSTKMPIHLLPSFAARVTMIPIARRSANGRERCGMSSLQKSRRCDLKKFMKEAGGVNACATLYARRCKRGQSAITS